jgi:hypothetical protein
VPVTAGPWGRGHVVSRGCLTNDCNREDCGTSPPPPLMFAGVICGIRAARCLPGLAGRKESLGITAELRASCLAVVMFFLPSLALTVLLDTAVITPAHAPTAELVVTALQVS